jgi:hypothetical protein
MTFDVYDLKPCGEEKSYPSAMMFQFWGIVKKVAPDLLKKYTKKYNPAKGGEGSRICIKEKPDQPNFNCLKDKDFEEDSPCRGTQLGWRTPLQPC